MHPFLASRPMFASVHQLQRRTASAEVPDRADPTFLHALPARAALSRRGDHRDRPITMAIVSPRETGGRFRLMEPAMDFWSFAVPRESSFT